MHHVLRAALFAAMIALTACSQAVGLGPDDDAAMRRPFDLIRARQYDVVTALFHPGLLAQPNMKADMRTMGRLIPREAPRRVTLYQWNKTFIDGGEVISTVHDYDYVRGHLLVTTVLNRPNTGPALYTTFRIRGVSAAEVAQSRFSLQGKSPVHYLMLMLTCAAPLLTIFALVRLYRGPVKVKRRWLWTIGMLIGLPTLSFNWATGDFLLRAYVQLLSAGVNKMGAPDAPWVLSVSLPIVAILFLLKKPKPPQAAAEPFA